MENPEEVLQALDEFQKLRPAEIPRELEEYLSWVAKTGDPVYQWPLIKALFREKLSRVMTDFYESCPTLELAPCPNVEQFNYDTMKSNLLERLESFANAPFTVQRICELLTAPRKEYNRVDKFMRAIEKNILVVSTREPGSAARRSENGDGMVNGSLEDNSHSAQSDDSATAAGQEVEMESWVRDCDPTSTITVQTIDTDSAMENARNLTEIIAPVEDTTVVKNLSSTENGSTVSFEKPEEDSRNSQTSLKPEKTTNFAPSTSDIIGITKLTAQIQPQDLNPVSGIQNLSAMVPETSGIVGEVPEAIMNEDTSSQPSLDLENTDNDFDPPRKLQTTFQSRDFVSGVKSPEFFGEEAKLSEKTVVESETIKTDPKIFISVEKTTDNQGETIEINVESKASMGSLEPTDVPVADNDTETTLTNVDSVVSNTSAEIVMPVVEDIEKPIVSETENTLPIADNVSTIVESVTVLDRAEDTVSNAKEEAIIESKEPIPVVENVPIVATVVPTTEPTKDKVGSMADITDKTTIPSLIVAADSKLAAEELEEIVEDLKPVVAELKPIVEKPANVPDDMNQKNTFSADQESITITETIGDDANVTKSIVPDPVPIVEEPKEIEPVAKPATDSTIVEITEELSEEPAVSEQLENLKEMLVETTRSEPVVEEPQPVKLIQPNDLFPMEGGAVVSEISVLAKELAPAESMEVDCDEPATAFIQDEPMEQETTDLDKS